MPEFKTDPKKQFSKRLARWTSVFWFLYMTWLSVLLMLVPVAALYCVYMGLIATSVMLLNVWAYTRNSIYEKGMYAMLDKVKLSMSLDSYKPEVKEETKEDESSDDEGSGNG